MELEASVLAGLTPNEEERQQVQAARKSLEEAATAALRAEGVDGVAAVQGSIAKDTWISGSADMDCFLVLPSDTPEDSLERLVTAVASQVLSSPRKKYAQHPYLIGTRDGFQVDLVPAYQIQSSDQRLSAVDRTPLHTAWVQEHLDETTRDQVRLAKQWCKGVDVYGAETRIGGFSGYLLEVLVHHHGDFAGLRSWAESGCHPRRISLADDSVNDDVSPLVVVDPVDPTRNCAAAVTAEALERIQVAAKAYREQPSKQFFHPLPARAATEEELDQSLQAQNATWMGLVLAPQTDRLDIVFPQFQRAARIASESLERAGFPVRRMQVDGFGDDRNVGMQWVLDDATLPATKTHTGPRADQEPNASRFREKWDHHPDATGPVEVNADGRLEVVVHVRERRAHEWLQKHQDVALPGKHVQKALPNAGLHDRPWNAPSGWGPRVADFVLDRRPWQRP